MAKKKNVQKNLQKKREKRNQQSKRVKFSGASGGAAGVSPAALTGLWERALTQDPLPAPAPFQEALEKLDECGSKIALGQHPNSMYPARMDLHNSMTEDLHCILDEATCKSFMQRSFQACRNKSEHNALLNAYKAAQGHMDSPDQLPGMASLLQHWGANLRPALLRWLPLWLNLFTPPQLLRLTDQEWTDLAAGSGEALSPDFLLACKDLSTGWDYGPFADVLLDMGCIMGWSSLNATQPGQDSYRRMWAETLWKWTQQGIEQETLQLKLAETTSPGQRRVLLGQVVENLLHTLPQVLHPDRLEEFVYDPQSPDWVADLAELQEAQGNLDDAYSLLTQLTRRQPDAFDAYDPFIRIGAALKKPAQELCQCAKEGLAALERQSGPHLDAKVEAEYRQRYQRWLEVCSAQL